MGGACVSVCTRYVLGTDEHAHGTDTGADVPERGNPVVVAISSPHALPWKPDMYGQAGAVLGGRNRGGILHTGDESPQQEPQRALRARDEARRWALCAARGLALPVSQGPHRRKPSPAHREEDLATSSVRRATSADKCMSALKPVHHRKGPLESGPFFVLMECVVRRARRTLRSRC